MIQDQININPVDEHEQLMILALLKLIIIIIITINELY